MVLPDHLKALLQDEEEQAIPSKEQQIAWLYQIINTELQKNEEEVDYDLVMECTDFLSELTSADTLYSIEEIEQKLNQLKSNLVQAKEDTQETRVPTIKRKCKPWLKVVAALAATFTVFFTTISVVAKTQGYGSAWEYVAVNTRRILGLDPGDQMYEDGISIVKHNNKRKTYSTIQELVEKENLGILYPVDLPKNLKIKEINQFYKDGNNYVLMFAFVESDDCIYIYSNGEMDIEKTKDTQKYSISGIDFYITQTESGIYHAIGWHNGLEYIFQSAEYENITTMLNCLKGY